MALYTLNLYTVICQLYVNKAQNLKKEFMNSPVGYYSWMHAPEKKRKKERKCEI